MRDQAEVINRPLARAVLQRLKGAGSVATIRNIMDVSLVVGMQAVESAKIAYRNLNTVGS
jgi:hypothetical protein